MRNTCYSTQQTYEQPAARSSLGRKALLLTLFLPLIGHAQTAREVTGKVVDGTGTGLPGVTVIVAGTTVGSSTGADGRFQLQVPATATSLTVSFIGYAKQTVDITGRNTIAVTLKDDAQALGDVVVVGYGAVRKSDLTGAVSVIGEKDFNKGTYTSPDQLIQGRTSGVQVTNSSGQPGGPATIKIRGNSAVTGTGQPLYVVDGVPLDGRSARPGLNASTAGGDGADSNPLNFLNPADIESVTVLKDASATAIYGSRAAYGVVLINTKRGKTGAPTLSIGASTGFSNILRRQKMLNAGQYRQALAYYGLPNTGAGSYDLGADTDALGALLRTAKLQNYNVAMSGGGENGRYRLSLGYLNQDGIVRKTGFKKYSANFSTNLEFLESKKLGVDVNIVTSQFQENLAPITTNAGSQGSLIGQALQWNPTESLYNPNGTLNIKAGELINPLAYQELFNDESRVTTILASVSPHYKITDWLEARVLYSINYSTGERRSSIGQDLINFDDIKGKGLASIGNNQLSTQQIANTLNFNKKIAPDLNLNALLGYEYTTFSSSGSNIRAYGNPDQGGFGNFGLDYTNYIQYSSNGSRFVTSFKDPFTALQSVFGRAILNYKERYLFTATLRRDQSSKFGPENRVGYFPSFAAAWDVSQEEFLKGNQYLNQLKIRAGYGRTGNQEFPAGSAQARYSLDNNGAQNPLNAASPALKWQSDTQYNAGVDLGFFDNRLTATVDYFYKTTTDLLFPTIPGEPRPSNAAVKWDNLKGEVVNKGVELALGGTILSSDKVALGLNANATFIRNSVSNLPGAAIPTGAVNGQGLSGAVVETIRNGLPINAFFLPQYLGLDDKGLPLYGPAFYAGSPNPKTLLGLSANARYGKLSLVANMTGVFGQLIYNNTLNAVGAIGGINARKNIALVTYENPIKEATGSATSASSRYLEKGNYLKMSNVTLSYAIGNLGKVFKGASVYATGQNLFVLTNYTGADPEINTIKTGANSVPSVGIDYMGYPSARTFTFGLNLSL
ncbi:SusC/RagA family TonB-linked outer membrane protein [Hymenobacter sp. UV11]|uniref:SusC/RagA family TonB-linked outer membrane protein n=1 Tax=Hymenobacter sp. UV11 TaxID=1849735 RepID=UPI00105CE6D0|nr:SusC/RagA family TonB-linked outer membrane protein [Hymenobacter sp. UV11]TFZ66901.1 SusC/RagA family TonB-linked outer membrane protein [Hymenobacter sp. UV11]